jgi:hypothetical protein
MSISRGLEKYLAPKYHANEEKITNVRRAAHASHPGRVKKRGTPQAFKERASTRYAEYLRRTENVRTVAGKRLRQRKVRMVREYMKMLFNSNPHAVYTHIVGKLFLKLQVAKPGEATLKALRTVMLTMLDLVEGPWKNAVGIRVAVFKNNSIGRWVEAPMKDIEEHYRDVFINDQVKNDPEAFLRGGKMGAGMDESYVIPVSILEGIKEYGTEYGKLDHVEKEFFNAMYTWFRQRTPDNVYALFTNKNIPAWYANDIRKKMRAFGVRV